MFSRLLQSCRGNDCMEKKQKQKNVTEMQRKGRIMIALEKKEAFCFVLEHLW